MLEGIVSGRGSANTAAACEQDFDLGAWHRPPGSPKNDHPRSGVRDVRAKQPVRPQPDGEMPVVGVHQTTMPGTEFVFPGGLMNQMEATQRNFLDAHWEISP